MKCLLVFLVLVFVFLVWVEGEWVGEFDYYVMVLSWLLNWCCVEGDVKGFE